MISIVVPVYNQAAFVAETLASIVAQSFQDWECILVNDGSTDSSEAILLEFVAQDQRFSYHKKENGGLASARNFGIEKATKPFIFPLDSDDLITSDCLLEVSKTIDKNPEAAVIHFDTEFFGSKTGLNKLPDYTYKTLLIQNCFVACTVFNKAIWEKCGGYDENLKSFEDWDFWIRSLTANSVVVKIPKVLFHYRKHEKESLTNRFKNEPGYYYSLYDYIYAKNKAIYDTHYGNPILAFHENVLLTRFNSKIKNTFVFKVYEKIKKIL